MKTQNELNALKKEYEELSAKLRELTEEELKQFSGGEDGDIYPCNRCPVYRDIVFVINRYGEIPDSEKRRLFSDCVKQELRHTDGRKYACQSCDMTRKLRD